MSHRPLRTLIVGGGNIGGGFDEARSMQTWPLTHAGAFLNHGGFFLSGCVEPNAARRQAFGKYWSIPSRFDSMSSALQSVEEWDVVSICSPTSHHHADVIAALRAKPKLIFCEKPLAPTLAQAQAIVDACKHVGVMLAVNHTRRWAPDVVALGHQMRSGDHGLLRSVSARYNKGVLNNGSHLLDLLNLWFGPLELLSAGTAIEDYDTKDPSIPGIFATESGMNISINCGHALDYSLFELEILTSTATIAMEDGGLAWRVRQPQPSPEFKGYLRLDAGRRYPGRYLEAMAGAANNIYDAVVHGATIASTGESALAAQTLCEALKASSRQKTFLPTSVRP